MPIEERCRETGMLLFRETKEEMAERKRIQNIEETIKILQENIKKLEGKIR